MKSNLKGVKIGIMGVGMVGGAMARYFKVVGRQLFLYDKDKNLGSPEEVNKADIIFICVPTPYDKKKGFNLSFVSGAFEKIKSKKIVVLRSTVWPGTTDSFQKRYPQHKILFNPEFLSIATADRDFRNPDLQIVGYTEKSKKEAKKVLSILPQAPFDKIVPAKEAEMLKYFHNVHGAVKVIFGNQFYDLCHKMGIDYDSMVECAAASKNICTKQYLNVWHKKFRGYGGSCFYKDTKALIQFGDKNGIKLELLKAAEKVNSRLLKEQGIKNPESIQ